KGEERIAGRNGHVLRAVNRIAHGPAIDLTAEPRPPEEAAGAGIEGEEIALLAAAEDQIRGGREYAGPRDVVHLEFPLLLERVGIERPYRAIPFVFLLH